MERYTKSTKVRRKLQILNPYQSMGPTLHIKKYRSTPRWRRSCREPIVAECSGSADLSDSQLCDPDLACRLTNVCPIRILYPPGIDAQPCTLLHVLTIHWSD